MPRLGRGSPIRPLKFRQPYRFDQRPTLGPFETEAEFPPVTVATPAARVRLGAFETEAEFPVLSLSYGQTAALGLFETEAEFPVLSLSYGQTAALGLFETEAEFPPISVATPVLPGDLVTGDYQIEYGGLLFGGHDNVFQILAGSVEGWDDLPSLDSGNVARPSRHGSWAGRRLSQDRQVSAIIGISTDTDFASSLAEIRRVLVPPDDETETALVVSGRDEMLLAYAAVDARVIPSQDYSQGWAPVSVRWVCSDPRRFGLTRYGVTVPVNGATQLFNGGNTATHPVIRIPGPATDPVLTNSTSDRTIQFTITLEYGDRLDIDTDAGTVAVGDTNRMSTLSGSSVPVQDFVLGVGINNITYTTTSGGAEGADFLWRDAHL